MCLCLYCFAYVMQGIMGSVVLMVRGGRFKRNKIIFLHVVEVVVVYDSVSDRFI